jgi:hypothetical protein
MTGRGVVAITEASRSATEEFAPIDRGAVGRHAARQQTVQHI